FADLASYVPLALLTPLLALMVASWPHDTASLRSHFRQAFVLLFVAATGLAVGFACVAQPVVELLYGTRYAPSVDASRYLVAGAALAAVYIGLVQLVPWPVAAGVAGAVFLALLHLLGADGPGGLRALVQNARFDSSAVEPGSRAPQTATPSER